MPAAKKPAPASIKVPASAIQQPAVKKAPAKKPATKPAVKKAVVKKPVAKKAAPAKAATKPAVKKPAAKKAAPVVKHALADILEGFKNGGAKRSARLDGNITDAQKEVLKQEAEKLGITPSTLNAAIIVAWLAALK